MGPYPPECSLYYPAYSAVSHSSSDRMNNKQPGVGSPASPATDQESQGRDSTGLDAPWAQFKLGFDGQDQQLLAPMQGFGPGVAGGMLDNTSPPPSAADSPSSSVELPHMAQQQMTAARMGSSSSSGPGSAPATSAAAAAAAAGAGSAGSGGTVAPSASKQNLPVVSLPVVCGPVTGILHVHRGMIVMNPNTPQQKEVSATEFERLGGRSATKKWRQSIRLLKPDGTPGRPVGEWYAQQGLDMSNKAQHVSPALQADKASASSANTTSASNTAALKTLAAARAAAAAAGGGPKALAAPSGPERGAGLYSMSAIPGHVSPPGSSSSLADAAGAAAAAAGALPPAGRRSFDGGGTTSTRAGSAAGWQQQQQQQVGEAPPQDESNPYARTCAAMVHMAHYLSGKRPQPPWELLGGPGVQPVVAGRPVNLRLLFLLVLSKGGFELLTQSNGWNQVGEQMQMLPRHDEPDPGRKLQQVYHDFLLRFERNAGPQNWAALLQLSAIPGNVPEPAPPQQELSGAGSLHPSLRLPALAVPSPSSSLSMDAGPLGLNPGSFALPDPSSNPVSPSSRVPQSPTWNGARPSTPTGLRGTGGVQKRRPPAGRSVSEANLASRVNAARERLQQKQLLQQQAAVLQQMPQLAPGWEDMRPSGWPEDCYSGQQQQQRQQQQRSRTPGPTWMHHPEHPLYQDQQHQQLIDMEGFACPAAAGGQEPLPAGAAGEPDWIPRIFSDSPGKQEPGQQQQQQQQPAAAAAGFVAGPDGGVDAISGTMTDQDWTDLWGLMGDEPQQQQQQQKLAPPVAAAVARTNSFGLDRAGLPGQPPVFASASGAALVSPFAPGTEFGFEAGSGPGVMVSRAMSAPQPRGRTGSPYLQPPQGLPCAANSPTPVAWPEQQQPLQAVPAGAAAGRPGSGSISSQPCPAEEAQMPSFTSLLSSEGVEQLRQEMLGGPSATGGGGGNGGGALLSDLALFGVDPLGRDGDSFSGAELLLLEQQQQLPLGLERAGQPVSSAAPVGGASAAPQQLPLPLRPPLGSAGSREAAAQQQQQQQQAQAPQQQQEQQELPPGVVPLQQPLLTSITPMGAELEALLDSPSFKEGACWMDISGQLTTLSRELRGAGPSQDIHMESGNWEAALDEAEGIVKLGGD